MSKSLLAVLFIFLSDSLHSQVLKGQVNDIAGNPIPFSTIRVQNTGYATLSNALGNYQLEVSRGTYILTVSAGGYLTVTDTIEISEPVTLHTISLQERVEELEEIIVAVKGKRDRGKEVMEQVIDKRSYFRDQLAKYSCSTYCFTSLEQEKERVPDSLKTDSLVAKEKLNITEWNGLSYYKATGHYKDIFEGFTDLSDKPSGVSAPINIGSAPGDLQPQNAEGTDPYIFVNGIRDADINLFENLIPAPGLTRNPLVSPMAYNALFYYSFYLESSFYDAEGAKVYEIRVDPRFREEALFEGTLFIRDSSWELVSYNLGINKGALTYFKEMRLICDYEKEGSRIFPTRREFTYMLKEGSRKINGIIRMKHSNYHFDFDDSPKRFWLESTVYTPEALDRDTSYWNEIRPFHLKTEEIRFIRQQDSILRYHASEAYLHRQDSSYNTLNVLDFLFKGVGFRNTFKKQELYIDALINQVVLVGVGGYRHKLDVRYDKEFRNGKKLFLNPSADYGFRNKDLKGSMSVSYTYNPRRFSNIFIQAGDAYDFLNGYQSIQGSFAPANRVRNRKFELSHFFEVTNGLYLKTGIFYSNRSSIDNIEYPSWVDVFGFFSKPQPFEGYKVFMTDIELSYHFRQKYQFKGPKKIIIGSQWPVLSLNYKKGLPGVFGGQSNFDFIEVRLTDEIHLNTLGNSEFKLITGAFVRKKDLRLVENKFFRTSDKWFFSNPVNSLQLLDTALNTANSYLQFNYIHHFNGFFLNKVWLINRLKLQETVGGSMLLIPDAHFAQAELYAGLERQFRIKKQLFKIGFYAVTYASSIDRSAVQFKVGVNFYNSFYRKWNY